MELLNKDCVILILNYLSLDSAREVGLTCQKFWAIYQGYLSRHPQLNHFKNIAIRIQQKEPEQLTYEYGGYHDSSAYKKLKKKYSVKVPNPSAGRRPWKLPGEKDTIRQYSEIPQDERILAHSTYVQNLDAIISQARDDRPRYNELPIPAFVKYLINIWCKYPSKCMRMAPFEVLKQYLDDAQELGAEYCLLFKTVQTPCTGPDISDDPNIWNVKDKMVDSSEVILAFSRTQETSFIFGEFDIDRSDSYPPFTICDACGESLPCPAKCKYYFIDYENRFPDSCFGKGKLEQFSPNGYYEGPFLNIFNYFVKNRYLLQNYKTDPVQLFLQGLRDCDLSYGVSSQFYTQVHQCMIDHDRLNRFFEHVRSSAIKPDQLAIICEDFDIFIPSFEQSGLTLEQYVKHCPRNID